MSNTQILGWALFHSLWQGVLITLACGVLFTLLRSPRVRYAVGCAGLLAMVACPIATFFVISQQPVPVLKYQTVTMPDSSTFSSAIQISDRSSKAPDSSWQQISNDLMPWLGRCWIGGVVVIAVFHCVGFVQLSRLRRLAAELDDAEFTTRLRRFIDRLEIRRRVEILVSDRVDCPAVIGFFKPAILWPAAALTGLTPMQIDALLAHELAHIRRHDAAINVVQVVIETTLFYHPCVWWLSKQVRQERENCCDDLAATLLGDRVEYAGALFAMETLRQSNTLVLQANGGSLMKRTKRLLEPTTPTAPRTRGAHGAMVVVALVTAITVWSGGLNAADAPSTPSTTSTTSHASAPATERADTNPDRPARITSLTIVDEWRLANRDQFVAELLRERDQVKKQIASLTQSPVESSLEELKLTDARLEELTHNILDIANAIRDDDAAGATVKVTTPAIAKRDPTFADLFAKWDAASADLAKLSDTLGEESPGVLRIRAQQQFLISRIDRLAKKVADLGTETSNAGATQSVQARPIMSEPQVDGSTALEVYKNLAIERATVLAAIRASEASPDSPATELLELNALLRRVNNQIAVLGVTKGDYYIDGKVTRPGVYSIGQKDFSLKQAIIAAGLTQIDDLPIHIIRLDPRSLKETVIQRNLKDIFDPLKSQIGEEGGDLMLKADDTVLVGISPPIKQPTTAPTK